MARPLVGITTYPQNDRGRYELPEEYVASVRRAGADAVLLPPGAGAVIGLLGRLDGLVLAGGGDLDPATYGGQSHETIYSLDEARDADELAIVHEVLDRGLPTLAICRGSQVLNVALGGTLHPHLPDVARLDENGEAVIHRDAEAIRRGLPGPVPHDVSVEAGSLVAEVMGATEVTPMSWHHQAIDRLGEGLRAVAWAPDGTIEATEHESHRWLASVQWHPELSAESDPTQQRLFDALVRVADGEEGRNA
ncbi:gamma-glutamyl-gamma-aminobutyrate hydrolase family protein [Actinospongicola halichondriae]|uniref:gamma-glutamyl-gamma-aminobutyrate hydrolase family protein n=1 Tax=Actinospongicola halichondriae TaxID=3236844 RepID=UPI003D589839